MQLSSQETITLEEARAYLKIHSFYRDGYPVALDIGRANIALLIDIIEKPDIIEKKPEYEHGGVRVWNMHYNVTMWYAARTLGDAIRRYLGDHTSPGDKHLGTDIHYMIEGQDYSPVDMDRTIKFHDEGEEPRDVTVRELVEESLGQARETGVLICTSEY